MPRRRSQTYYRGHMEFKAVPTSKTVNIPDSLLTEKPAVSLFYFYRISRVHPNLSVENLHHDQHPSCLSRPHKRHSRCQRQHKLQALIAPGMPPRTQTTLPLGPALSHHRNNTKRYYTPDILQHKKSSFINLALMRSSGRPCAPLPPPPYNIPRKSIFQREHA